MTSEKLRSTCVINETTVTANMLSHYHWMKELGRPIPVAKSVSSNTAGHILQNYRPDWVRRRKEVMAATYYRTTAERPCHEDLDEHG